MMAALPNAFLPWPITYEAVCFIGQLEGCRLDAYQDIGGVWTIGWGETRGVKQGDVWTQAEADRRFLESLNEFALGVSASLQRPANENEFGAMVSLAYNIGLGGFARSTVLRCHNAGDAAAAARAFALWNQVGGVESKGLTTRRAHEAALYLTPVDDAPVLPTPETPDTESSLASSPIAGSGIASIASGIVAAASAVFEPVRALADKLGVDPLLLVAGVVVVAGVIAVQQRRKQRKKGWA